MPCIRDCRAAVWLCTGGKSSVETHVSEEGRGGSWGITNKREFRFKMADRSYTFTSHQDLRGVAGEGRVLRE